MEKEIYARVWNPENALFKQKKSEKAVGYIYSCKCPEKCELYAKGNCVMLKNYCPYGSKNTTVGYSRMARKFSSWIYEFKDKHKDACNAGSRLKQPEKMEYFMDLVYIPISHLGLNENIDFVDGGGFFSNGYPVVKRSDFNEEFISKQIIRFRPKALMGGVIWDYQEKEVPKFLRWLKRLDPALFDKTKALNPDHSAFAKLSDVGKKAVLQTLNPNIGTFISTKGGTWTWDGEYLYSSNAYFYGSILETKEIQECRLKPTDGAVVKVTDDNQVNDNTIFID